MTTKRYLDVRYDVTGLSADEVGQLALEAAVQAERSEGHPAVEVESETIEVEEDEPSLESRVQEALERAHDRSTLKLGDADLDVYADEIVRAVRGEKPKDLVGNVIFDATCHALSDALGEADHGRYAGRTVWFDPYLAVYDDADPGDGPLFVMYADVRGDGATVYAPACGDAHELERRLTRAFGDDGWALDDHAEAVQVAAGVDVRVWESTERRRAGA